MAAPATHYVKSDDVHIAYQVIGDGPLDLLFVPGFVSHIEATWQSPTRSSFFRRLASFSRLILFDKRGTGMSDRGSQIFTLEQRMHDVRAILDEVGSKRAALFGVPTIRSVGTTSDGNASSKISNAIGAHHKESVSKCGRRALPAIRVPPNASLPIFAQRRAPEQPPRS